MSLKKTTAWITAVLLLAAAAASCAKRGEGDGTSVGSSAESAAPVGELTAEDAYRALKEEAGDRFDGEDVTILYGGNVANNDFFIEEDSEENDNLDSAQYRRRQRLEEDLGIKIETVERIYWAECFGGGPFHQDVQASVAAGGTDYDLIYGCIYECASLTMAGQLSSLSSVPHVNLNGSWYDQDAVESLSIRGEVFYINGDFSIYDDEYTHCILFNKNLAADQRLDPARLYQHVREGTWTVDQLGIYVRNMYHDANGNTIPDFGDRFGLLTWNDSAVAMVTACGTRIATVNDDGTVELTMMNETVIDMLNRYLAYAYDSSVAINYQTLPSSAGMTGDQARDAIFTSDQAVFAQSMITYVRNYRGMLSEFGILPYPKYNEQQSRYYTYSTLSVQNASAVPLVVEDLSKTGVFLEAASILGQTTVKPEYYEVMLQGKVTRDDESKEMLDIIFASKVYDVGMFYNVGSMYGNILTMFAAKQNSYNILYAANRMKMESELEAINDSILAFITEAQ